MSIVVATLRMYGEALSDTARSLARSVPAIAVLLLCSMALAVIGMTVGGIPFLGGFALAFAEAAGVGWYLSIVAIGVLGRRRLELADLPATFGQRMWDVMSVLFVFWIAAILVNIVAQGLAATPVGPWIELGVMLLTAIASLVFNPAPEMIYQERVRSFELLGEAAKFMGRNWPEWLGAHVVAAGLLALWGWFALSQTSIWFAVTALFMLYGPFFGFLQSGGLALDVFFGPGLSVAPSGGIGALFTLESWRGWVAGILLLVFTHAFMLFRGHLYKRLRTSSRRSRAWQSQLR